MSTIKDIARLAGVSHGTVSNVLNGKNNVSSEKIKLVEKAVKQLGYKVDMRARNLRQNKISNIAIIIPDIKLKHYADFYVSLKDYLKNYNYYLELYITDGNKDTERQIINQIISSKINSIVTLTCLNEDDDTYNTVPDDITIVFIGRKVKCSKPKAIFASFDYKKAGNEIADYILSHGYKKAVYFSDTHRFANNNLMFATMKNRLEEANGSIDYFTSDNNLMLNECFDIVNSMDNFDVIIASNIDRARAIMNVHRFISNKPLPCIITLSTTYTLCEDNFVRYELNFKRFGLLVGRRIVENNKNSKKNYSNIFIENDGIGYMPPNLSVYSVSHKEQINLLAPSSHSIDIFKKIVPNFTRITNLNVKVSTFDKNELYDVIKAFDGSGYYDLICMDSSWLPELGKRIYYSLPEIYPNKISTLFRNIISELKEYYSMIDGIPYALPFDSNVQMLLYRKDLFEDFKVQRLYFEQHREKLTVPITFEQFNKIAFFFTKSHNPNSQTEFGATIDYNTPNAAMLEFLPRLFSLNNSKDNYTEEDIKLALNNLLDTYNCTKKIQNSKSITEFMNGKTAMCIASNAEFSTLINSKYSKITGKIGFAQIPGGRTIMSGNVIGFAKNSTKNLQSIELINWLFSNDIAAIFSSLGGSSPCRKVYENTNIIQLYPWFSISKKSFKNLIHNQQFSLYNNYNNKHFANIVGIAVQSVLTDMMSYDDAIKHIKKVFLM